MSNKNLQWAYVDAFNKSKQEFELELKIENIATKVVQDYFDRHKDELKQQAMVEFETKDIRNEIERLFK